MNSSGKLVAEPVFDGFHIMVGAALDGFDLFRIGLGELRLQLNEMRDGGG